MPRFLDLYSCAGVGADGYRRAGFDIVGVDVFDQPGYPYPFIHADALAVLTSDLPESFDVIGASPPCQEHTIARNMRDRQGGESRFGDLLTPTLALLRERWSHKPWIVENVPGAPGMDGAVMLCGSSFGLDVQRHRLFLSNVPLTGLPCHHERFPLDPITGKPRPWGVYHVPADDIAEAARQGRSVASGGRTALSVEHARALLGVDELRPVVHEDAYGNRLAIPGLVARPITWDELKEGIPPAYTHHLGTQLLAHLGRHP